MKVEKQLGMGDYHNAFGDWVKTNVIKNPFTNPIGALIGAGQTQYQSNQTPKPPSQVGMPNVPQPTGSSDTGYGSFDPTKADSGAPDKKGLSTGAIVGISIGALAIIGTVIFLVVKK